MNKFAVQLSKEAQLDIIDVLDYYKKIKTSLAQKLWLEVTKVIEKISTNPLKFQIRYRTIRIAFTKTFPYGIHFIFEENTVFILSFLHTKRYFR